MKHQAVSKIVILGGGTAGWMAASALAESYKSQCHSACLQISLIESGRIGTAGVGEATVPSLVLLHEKLGITEREFVKATGATFKLGIEFKDWYRQGHSFFHPFSQFGLAIEDQDFYQCWLKLYKEGVDFDFQDFCLAIAMARQGRFSQPDDNAATPLAKYNYAYHFDASRYATFLKSYAQARSVERIEGEVLQVKQDPATGDIVALQLQDGRQVAGDLFVDCSGFRGMLIGETLQGPFTDWSHYLPCDRALVVQSEDVQAPLPYTRSSAMPAGWSWRIPLQNRVGNGYVYCSEFCTPEVAKSTLLKNLEGKLLTEPRSIQFRAGIRNQYWQKNCVALGLASGFIEPLESTSISLIQTGIEKLIQFLPDLQIRQDQVDEANRLNKLEYERIRDFIILHYISSQREDSEFWRSVRAMNIPDSLQMKLDAFSQDGTIILQQQESFREASWVAMHAGFKRIPLNCQRGVEALNSEKLKKVLEKMRHAIKRGADHAPTHAEFLETV